MMAAIPVGAFAVGGIGLALTKFSTCLRPASCACVRRRRCAQGGRASHLLAVLSVACSDLLLMQVRLLPK